MRPRRMPAITTRPDRPTAPSLGRLFPHTATHARRPSWWRCSSALPIRPASRGAATGRQPPGRVARQLCKGHAHVTCRRDQPFRPIATRPFPAGSGPCEQAGGRESRGGGGRGCWARRGIVSQADSDSVWPLRLNVLVCAAGWCWCWLVWAAEQRTGTACGRKYLQRGDTAVG